MKKILLAGILLLAGCGAVHTNTPPATLAPDYYNSIDESLGKGLASVNFFVKQEKVNYAAATQDVKAAEKSSLNNLIMAVDYANTVYVDYHNGSATLAQAQEALTKAQTLQSILTSTKGVR